MSTLSGLYRTVSESSGIIGKVLSVPVANAVSRPLGKRSESPKLMVVGDGADGAGVFLFEDSSVSGVVSILGSRNEILGGVVHDEVLRGEVAERTKG
jgi:hypothetical protein